MPLGTTATTPVRFGVRGKKRHKNPHKNPHFAALLGEVHLAAGCAEEHTGFSSRGQRQWRRPVISETPLQRRDTQICRSLRRTPPLRTGGARRALLPTFSCFLAHDRRFPVMQIANCLLMSRPKTAEEARSWIAANKGQAEGHIAGQVVPASWTEGVDYYFAEGTDFQIQEVVVLKRSDGSVKFGLLQKLNEPVEGQAVVLVEVGPEMNSLKTVFSKVRISVGKPGCMASFDKADGGNKSTGRGQACDGQTRRHQLLRPYLTSKRKFVQGAACGQKTFGL